MSKLNISPQSHPEETAAKSGSPVGLSIIEDYNSTKVPVNISESEWIAVAQVRNNQLLTYSCNINRTRSRAQLKALADSRERKKFPGDISSHSRKKIKRIVHNWIEAINAYGNRRARRAQAAARTLGFVTLTLSSAQRHDDRWIKRNMLNRFLQELKRQYNVKNVVWRAEKQKNGNIHFHILVDGWIDWEPLRMLWNQIQEENGYLEPFAKKYGHRNPNSTDIHSLKSVRNPAAYITKYMTKNQPGLTVKGRVWSASRKLSECRYFEFHPDERFWALCEQLKKDRPDDIFEGETFTVYNVQTFNILDRLGSRRKSEYWLYYQELFKQITA